VKRIDEIKASGKYGAEIVQTVERLGSRHPRADEMNADGLFEY
jgi:hypothetical protein